MAIPLGCVLPHTSRDRPGRRSERQITCRPYLVLLPVGLAMPPLLPEARCALTAPFQPCRGFRPVGGVISVALSLGSPPADVIRHRVLRGARTFLPATFSELRRAGHNSLPGVAEGEVGQPSGHLTRGHYARARSAAASACKVVVSNSGTLASSGLTRIGISVQPRMMPCAPSVTSLAKTRR